MKQKYQKISYRQLMHYTPYDNKFNLKEKGFTLEDFYREIFVSIPEFQTTRNQLKETLLDPESDYFRPINILSGYSGNGKTTFIKWLQRDLDSSEYYFEVINLIQDAHRLLDKENLIIACLRSYLIRQLKVSQSVPFVLSHEEYFYRFFRKKENIRETYWEDLHALEIFRKANNDIRVFRQIDFLVEALDFKQILLLFFLEKIFELRGKGYRCCVFCFDNIDQIEHEYLSKDLWDDFLDIYNILIDISERDELGLSFNVKGRLTFLMVIREANLAIINAQMSDRIRRLVKNKKFILTHSGVEILKARKNFAEKYLSKTGKIHELVKTLTEENYTQNVFLPLFNYDYRRLFDCILFAMEPVYTAEGKQYRSLVSHEDYKNTQKLSKHGSRGIIFQIMIKYLIRNNFLKRFATNSDRPKGKGYCRASRLILTVLCSMCYPVLPEENLVKLHGISPKTIGLFDLVQSMEKLFPPSEITRWLSEFFRVTESSWAHLITIYNKQVTPAGIDFNLELILINNILEGKTIRDLAKSKDELNKIKVQINASGYIYIRYLITHFEYFSSLVVDENPQKKFRPLFQMTTFDGKRWVFEDVIESVLESVKSYKKMTDVFFELEMFPRGYSAERYCKSHFAFRGLENKGKLYLTRVVTTHIEYLDEFRWYLFNNKGFKQEAASTSKREKLPLEKYLSLINQYLVERIEEYIVIWEQGKIVDNSVKKLMGTFKKSIQAIRAQEFQVDTKHWVAIRGDYGKDF